MNLYFGSMHSHIKGDLCHRLEAFDPSHRIEMAKQVNQLYAHAQKNGMDFIAYTEHHSMGDMMRLSDQPHNLWSQLVTMCDSFNRPGLFTTLHGFEFQDETGEYNVYMKNGGVMLQGSTFTDLMNCTSPDRSDVLFAAHNRPNPTDWNFPKHDLFRLVEIMNDGCVPFENWVALAIKKGFRPAFIGGSDDHSLQPSQHTVTGVYADSNDRHAIFEALRSGRCFAACRVRPMIRFSVNGKPMGHIGFAQQKREIFVSHECTHLPFWCGIIKNGRLLYSHMPSKSTFMFRYTDEHMEYETDAYYVKFLYRDHRYAFASPIYVKAEKPKENLEMPYDDSYQTRPPILGYSVKQDFGRKVGWNNRYNAGALITPSMQAYKQLNDMVIHIAPDPILACRNGAYVFPANRQLIEQAPGKSPKILAYPRDPESFVLTSLCQCETALLAGGYEKGVPKIDVVRGDYSIQSNIRCKQPFLYEDKVVSPRFVDACDHFVVCIVDHGALLFNRYGETVGLIQKGFPLYPTCIKIVDLDCILVTDCEGYLYRWRMDLLCQARLDFKVLQRHRRTSICVAEDRIYATNNFDKLPLRAPASIDVYTLNGNYEGSCIMDLANARGTSLVGGHNHAIAAMHNPNQNVSAAFRHLLNDTGCVRLFDKTVPMEW